MTHYPVFVGMIFLHESLTWYELLGGLVVLFGAAIGQGRFAGHRYTLRS